MVTPAKAVLVARPQGQATALMHLLAAAGYLPLWASPLRIVPEAEALRRLPQQLAAADVVFFVSPSAVAVAAAAVDLSAWSRQWVAVGQATAKALHGVGVAEVTAPVLGHDSEAVLALPLWAELAQRPRATKVLIVRGQGGRPWLAQALREAGHEVSFAEVYQRQPQAIDWPQLEGQLGTATLVAACVTSSDIATHLWAQVPDSLQQAFKNLLYLTPHERIGQTLQTLGANRVVTCALGDDNMVLALQAHERA